VNVKQPLHLIANKSQTIIALVYKTRVVLTKHLHKIKYKIHFYSCLCRWYRLRGSNELPQPNLADLDQDVLRQCHVFVKYHMDNCKRTLLHSKR